MALSRSVGIARRLGRLAAIGFVVFPFGYTDFVTRKPCRRSTRIFRSRHCAAFAYFRAHTAVACCDF